MPDGISIPGGPTFIGFPQPPDVPCDPTGEGWRGPPGPIGPVGPMGPMGPQGPMFPDAPSDGQVYGRQNGAWNNIAAGGPFLPLTGGTVAGPTTFTAALSAPTAAPGDNDTSVATTAFVTSAVSAATAGGPFLPLIGGTVSGATTFSAGPVTVGSGAANIVTITPGANATTAATLTASGSAGINVPGNVPLGANITYFGRGITQTWSGSTLDTTKMPLYVLGATAGTTTFAEIPTLAYFAQSSANINAPTTLVDGLEVNFVTGGAAAAAAAWNAASVSLNDGTLATNDKSAGTTGAFVTLQLARRASKNQGGTALTPAGAFGQNWGIDIVNIVKTGATNILNQIGVEVDLTTEVGASVLTRIGYAANHTTSDKTRGAMWDQAFAINNGSTVTWREGLVLGGRLSPFMTHGSDSTLIVYRTSQDWVNPLANVGVDFLDATFTSSAFRTAGFDVDPVGNVRIGTAYTTQTTGLAIDVKGSVGNIPSPGGGAIAAGGTGYPVSKTFIADDVNGGVYIVGTDASGIITTIPRVIRQPHYPTTSPPATFAVTPRDPDNTGTGATLSGTWITNLRALSLQPSGGTLGVFGATPIARPTGWGAATGTATRSTFVTSSVTLPTLAEHVKALIDDLIAYGLIGP